MFYVVMGWLLVLCAGALLFEGLYTDTFMPLLLSVAFVVLAFGSFSLA